MSPRDIIRTARHMGISGVAITDHNDSKSWKDAGRAAKEYGILFIPGIEIGSRSGHVIGLGLNEHIDSGLSLDETVEKIHQQGGIAVAPHPFDIRSEGIRNNIHRVDAVEVFNSLNIDRLSNRLALSKAEEYGKARVVGSDAHNKDMFGLSLNDINAYDMDNAFKEIKAGRIEFSTNYVPIQTMVEWARDRIATSYMDVIKHVNSNYSSPKAWIAKEMLKRFVLHRNKTWDSVWNIVANLSVGLSVMYGGLRFITYY